MIALIPMEIGPLATNQAAISVRQIQKFTTMAKTVQLAYMHKHVPKTQRIYTSNAVKEHYTLNLYISWSCDQLPLNTKTVRFWKIL